MSAYILRQDRVYTSGLTNLIDLAEYVSARARNLVGDEVGVTSDVHVWIAWMLVQVPRDLHRPDAGIHHGGVHTRGLVLVPDLARGADPLVGLAPGVATDVLAKVIREGIEEAVCNKNKYATSCLLKLS